MLLQLFTTDKNNFFLRTDNTIPERQRTKEQQCSTKDYTENKRLSTTKTTKNQDEISKKIFDI
jgi:hypothetical protein